MKWIGTPPVWLAAPVALALACLMAGPGSADEQAVAEAITEYMDFATEAEGIILPQQLTEDVFHKAYFVDARSAEDHAAGTIPGATNIDWRALPGRLDELPQTGLVVVFCNTGVRSSQATFAARLMGRTNVVVMQSGYIGWLRDAGYRPQ
ncbi:rhodanese-like domain-containing protein [Seohaeicola saemankumensis]|nr:rhodanese-like domain-containing protein [Seohaeicola saemankumensis]MCA0870149.1 rhodanese-like domain-containing protein [Seohaeicola saemankumensis]